MHSCALFLIEGVGISRRKCLTLSEEERAAILTWECVLEVYPCYIHHAGVDGLLPLFLFTFRGVLPTSLFRCQRHVGSLGWARKY